MGSKFDQIDLLKSINDFPFILAPLAGYTDLPFRLLVNDFHKVLTFTEMVSAKAITYKDKKTDTLLKNSPSKNSLTLLKNHNELKTLCQLFGSEPKTIKEAIKIIDKRFDFVGYDINMGCPVPKIFNNGEGSALLKNIPLIKEIVKNAVDATNKPISIKLRIGVDNKNINIGEVLEEVKDLGLSMITIHPRTRSDYYSGDLKYDIVRDEVSKIIDGDLRGEKITFKNVSQNKKNQGNIFEKKSVIKNSNVRNTKEDNFSCENKEENKNQNKTSTNLKINRPLFTISGNIFSMSDALNRINDFDTVMIARGALGRPYIFKGIAEGLKKINGFETVLEADKKLKKVEEISVKKKNEKTVSHSKLLEIKQKYDSLDLRKETCLKHLNLLSFEKTEKIAVKEIRKFIGYYFKGEKNIKTVKDMINKTEDIKEIKNLIYKI